MLVRQRVTEHEGHDVFDVWTDFLPRKLYPRETLQSWTRRARKDSRKPQRLSWRSQFALSRYRIDAEIGNELGVKAVTRVTLRTGPDPLRAFPFEIARAMQVDCCTHGADVDGAPAELRCATKVVASRPYYRQW